MTCTNKNGIVAKTNDRLEKYMMERAIALIIGYILDLMFGDPHFLWHPVVGIGKLIQWLQNLLEGLFQIDLSSKDERNRRKEVLAGGVLVLLVLIITS